MMAPLDPREFKDHLVQLDPLDLLELVLPDPLDLRVLMVSLEQLE